MTVAFRNEVPPSVRRSAYFALLVSIVHVIFGAIVRISGSGMGCGDNWPKCYGHWFPPLNRPDLIIEVSHRYLAAALFVSIAALVFVTWRNLKSPGVRGPQGVWPAALVAVALWFAPALFGAVTVFLGNPAWATVVHKVLAAALIAVLIVATIRAGGLGGNMVGSGIATRRATSASTAAAGMALLVIILGALTAKIPGAAVACAGFPLCGPGSLGGGGQHVQLTHRVLAYLLVLHLIGLPIQFRKRKEPGVLVRLAWVAMSLGVLQVLWAAWMVTGGFPAVVRSLHQATGILIWTTTFAMAYHARIAKRRAAEPSSVGMIDSAAVARVNA